MHTSIYTFRNPKSNGEHDQRIFLTFLMLHKNRSWAKSDEQTKIFKWEPMTLKQSGTNFMPSFTSNIGVVYIKTFKVSVHHGGRSCSRKRDIYYLLYIWV